MSLDNPTGVNSFTGTSDETQLNQAAQGLWDRIAADQAPSPAASPAPEPAADVPAAPADAQAQPEAPADSSSDEVEYSDLDDYLTKAKLERDSFLSLPVKLKVDGKDEQATLKELLEAGQLRRHAQLETQKASERARQWESERTQAQQAIASQWQQSQQLAQLAQQELLREYQNVTPTSDPGKFLEGQQRWNAIQQWLNNANQAQQLQQQQLLQQQIQTERAKMFEAIPEWRDEAKFKTAQTQLTSYATERGFTQAELSQLVDHRYMRVLADAARVKDLQAQVDTLKAQLEGKTQAAVKKVRAAPQIVSTGARQAPRDPKVVALDSAKDRFMKSGNPDAQAAYAQALLNAGLGA